MSATMPSAVDYFLEDIGCHSTYICLSSISLLFVINFIFVPFSIYISIRYNQIRHIQAMTRRYPQTVMFLSILNIFGLFVVSNYMLISNGLILDYAYANYWILWLGPFIYEPWFLLIIIVNVYRLWLIHFDIKFNVGKTRQKWQSLLNKDGGDDWYSRNKNRWGDWRWLYKPVAAIWIILCIPIIILLCLESDVNDEYKVEELVYAFTIVLVSIAALIIWCKVPYFEDEFYIFKEMKLLVICAIVLCVSWFGLIFWTIRGNAFHIAQIGILSVFNFMQIFVSQFIVVHRLKHTKNTFKRKLSFQHHLKMREKELLRILLNSAIGIEEYVKHLQKEFSLENILFLIEILQWLYASTKKQWTKYDIHPMYPDNINFKMSKIIPISSINGNKETDWYTKITQIHQKYIDTTATFEVNLPYRIHAEFDNLFRLYQMKMDIAAGIYKPKMKAKLSKSPKTPKSPSLTSKKSSNIWTFTKKLTGRKSKVPALPKLKNTGTDIDSIENDIDKLKMSTAVDLKRGTVMHASQLSPVNELPEVKVPPPIKTIVNTNSEYTRSMSIDRANDADTTKQNASLLKVQTPPMLAAPCKMGHFGQITCAMQMVRTDSANLEETQESSHFHENVLNDFLDDLLPSVAEEIERNASLTKNPTISMGSIGSTLDLRIHLGPSEDIDKMETTRSLSGNLTPKSAGFLEMRARSFNQALRANLSGNSEGRRKTVGPGTRSSSKMSKRFTAMFSLNSFRSKSSNEPKREVSENKYEIDEEEKIDMETCQSIGLEQFVTISCFCIREILDLNHQSLTRFRKTKYFATFNGNVNLKHLLEELHSDGTIRKSMV